MPNRPLLLGHRGARSVTSIPENSLQSFNLAMQHGCDGFEFDVRLTADGSGVICHDARVGGIEVAAARRNQLSQLALLSDVLARYRQGAFLDIELKVAGLEDVVLRALRENLPAGYVVSSFLPEVLNSLHAHDAEIPLGFICDREAYLPAWRKLPIQYLIPHFRLVTQKLIEEAHRTGKKILAWTVNDREEMLGLAEWGADGIISDETERLVETLDTKRRVILGKQPEE